MSPWRLLLIGSLEALQNFRQDSLFCIATRFIHTISSGSDHGWLIVKFVWLILWRSLYILPFRMLNSFSTCVFTSWERLRMLILPNVTNSLLAQTSTWIRLVQNHKLLCFICRNVSFSISWPEISKSRKRHFSTIPYCVAISHNAPYFASFFSLYFTVCAPHRWRFDCLSCFGFAPISRRSFLCFSFRFIRQAWSDKPFFIMILAVNFTHFKTLSSHYVHKDLCVIHFLDLIQLFALVVSFLFCRVASFFFLFHVWMFSKDYHGSYIFCSLLHCAKCD